MKEMNYKKIVQANLFLARPNMFYEICLIAALWLKFFSVSIITNCKAITGGITAAININCALIERINFYIRIATAFCLLC